MLVLLEVLGQISDTLGQQSNLDLRGAGVTLVGSVSLDDFLLFLSRKCTASSLCCCAVLPVQYRRALYPRAKYAKGKSYTRGRPNQTIPQATLQTTFSSPPNSTTASEMLSITKNSKNDAQLRVSTLNFDSFLMQTSSPTHSTA